VQEINTSAGASMMTKITFVFSTPRWRSTLSSTLHPSPSLTSSISVKKLLRNRVFCSWSENYQFGKFNIL